MCFAPIFFPETVKWEVAWYESNSTGSLSTSLSLGPAQAVSYPPPDLQFPHLGNKGLHLPQRLQEAEARWYVQRAWFTSASAD